MKKKIILLAMFFISPLLIKNLEADPSNEIKALDQPEGIVEKKINDNDNASAQISDVESIENPFIQRLPKPEENVNILPPPDTTIPVDVQPIVPTPDVSPPVEPDVEAPPPPPNFTISGLIWNTERPQAIINGSQGTQILDVGDRLENWQVQTINQSGVELIGYGQNVFISSDFSSEKVSKN